MGSDQGPEEARGVACNIPPMPIQPNAILDQRFQVDALIAVGGQSIVYRGTDMSTGRQVAIKVMQEMDGVDSAIARRQFEREYEVLRVGGPGLPQGHALFEVEGRPVVVEEWLDGATLDAEGTAVPQERAAHHGLSLLRILDGLHRRRPPIVVRDIKPRNLIIEGDAMWLVDLSASHPMFGNPDTVALGTPGFAAPEQFLGHSEPRSDLFSAGVVMHYLLTGLDARDASKLPCSPRARRTDVSAALDAVVQRATHLDPEARFASAAEMIGAVEQALRGVMPGAPRPVSPTSPVAGLVAQALHPTASRAATSKALDAAEWPLVGVLTLLLFGFFFEAMVRAVLVPWPAGGSTQWVLAWIVSGLVPAAAAFTARTLGVHPLVRLLSTLWWLILAAMGCAWLTANPGSLHGPWSPEMQRLGAWGLLPFLAWWIRGP